MKRRMAKPVKDLAMQHMKVKTPQRKIRTVV
jgi:hypothetical protein